MSGTESTPSLKARNRAKAEAQRANQEARKATFSRRNRRADALYRHAKLVYDYDRDFNHEFSNE